MRDNCRWRGDTFFNVNSVRGRAGHSAEHCIAGRIRCTYSCLWVHGVSAEYSVLLVDEFDGEQLITRGVIHCHVP